MVGDVVFAVSAIWLDLKTGRTEATFSVCSTAERAIVEQEKLREELKDKLPQITVGRLVVL